MITVHGVNTNSINLLAADILDLADEALRKLYDIETLINNSESFFKGTTQQKVKTKFDELSTSFETVRQNLTSYAEELNRLTKTYKEKNEAINLDILKDSEKLG